MKPGLRQILFGLDDFVQALRRLAQTGDIGLQGRQQGKRLVILSGMRKCERASQAVDDVLCAFGIDIRIAQ